MLPEHQAKCRAEGCARKAVQHFVAPGTPSIRSRVWYPQTLPELSDKGSRFQARGACRQCHQRWPCPKLGFRAQQRAGYWRHLGKLALQALSLNLGGELTLLGRQAVLEHRDCLQQRVGAPHFVCHMLLRSSNLRRAMLESLTEESVVKVSNSADFPRNDPVIQVEEAEVQTHVSELASQGLQGYGKKQRSQGVPCCPPLADWKVVGPKRGRP